MKNSILFIFFCYSFLAIAQESYYTDVNLNLTGTTLKEALAVKITQTHTNFLTYTPGIWEASKVTDVNPTNSTQVLLLYGWENGTDTDSTNDRTRGIDLNGGSMGNWNREHVFSRSLGIPNLGEAGPGADAHHLRPTDVQTNSSRGNRKFSDATGTAGATTESYIDALSNTSSFGWYPGDEWKGDVARMVMYMYLRYGNRCLPTNVGLGDASATPDDMIDLFLQWNASDPVSDIEKQRNTYHENTTNTFAQGNRNPFIDNPILATRIWGGPKAQDIWGIYTNSDTESPTAPTNVSVTNSTTFSADISWSAATDNIAVTSYDVYIDDNLVKNTTLTNTTILDLNSNSSFTLYVIAKDIVNNQSPPSTTINVTTLQDIEAPTVPKNLTITNETGTSFVVTWDTSSDNTAVTAYDVFVDGTYYGSTNETMFTLTNLTISTTYNVQVLAKDAVNNTSNLSEIIIARTTDGSTTTANELFFSEYFEGSFGTNKALEIANVTSNPIDLSAYSIKRQSNGGKDGAIWANELVLSGLLLAGDVYVVINASTTIQKLIDEADFYQPNTVETNYGAPINFNGNDPVGLFKNEVLIDIIGAYNEGGSNFAKDVTLRRKKGVISPNTAFDIITEWDEFKHTSAENFEEDFGQHSASLILFKELLANFSIYPNPVKTYLYLDLNLQNTPIKSIVIYDLMGKEMMFDKNPSQKINVHSLKKGVYILKIETQDGFSSLKFVKL